MVTLTDGVADAETGWPVLLTSNPDALPENVAVPTTMLWYVQVNIWLELPEMSATAGVGPLTSVAPVAVVSVGFTASAVASPEFATVSETVICWPVFAVV